MRSHQGNHFSIFLYASRSRDTSLFLAFRSGKRRENKREQTSLPSLPTVLIHSDSSSFRERLEQADDSLQLLFGIKNDWLAAWKQIVICRD